MLVLQLFAPMKNHVLAEGTLTPSEINLKLDKFELRVKEPIGTDSEGNPIYQFDEVDEDVNVIDFDIYDILRLNFTYNFDDKIDVSGKTLTFSVPELFEFHQAIIGDLVVDETDVIGSFAFDHEANTITMTFDDGLTNRTVDDGEFGLGLRFSSELFSESIIEKIEFDESLGKDFTIVKDPKTSIEQLTKFGTPNKEINPDKIEWEIDVFNFSVDERSGILEDVLPEGLQLDLDSFNLVPIIVGSDKVVRVEKDEHGAINRIPISEDAITYNVGTNTFSLEIDNVPVFKGYRVEFTTSIVDRTKTPYENNASFLFNSDDEANKLNAKGTVDQIEFSSLIEKYAEVIEGTNQIKWTIDINKAQSDLTGVTVEDLLPDGLSLINGSVELYELSVAGSEWVASDEDIFDSADYNVETDGQKLTFTLGDIGTNAYRLIYKTDTDFTKVNGGHYQVTNIFENNATLLSEGSPLDTDEAYASIIRSSLIEKTLSSEDYSDEVTWTVWLNNAKHNLKDVDFEDELPEGLDFISGSVKVYKVDGTTEEDYTPISTNIVENKLTIEFGDISDTYKIVYKTKVDYDKIGTAGGVTNKAGMTGTNGSGEDYETYNPKTTLTKKQMGIDYNNSTIAWEITIDPKREPLKDVVIEDRFIPFEGISLIGSTLEVTLGGNPVATTNYSIITIKNGDDKVIGFDLKFVDDYIVNERLVVKFKTKFEPELITGNENTKYTNYATGRGIGVYNNENVYEGSDNAKAELRSEVWVGGKKLGRLVHYENGELKEGWKSGYDRLIEWEVYTNYLNQVINGDVSIKDVLQFDGEILNDSLNPIKVNYYTIRTSTGSSNGNTIIGSEVASELYEIIQGSDKKEIEVKFAATNSPYGNTAEDANRRVMISFLSSVPGRSASSYQNKASHMYGEKTLDYVTSVAYGESENILKKEKVGSTPQNTVYVDDVIDWEILLNEGLSTIGAGATVVDTISTGLVLIVDSVTLTSNGVQLVEDVDYSLEVAGNNVDGNDETEMTIVFKYKIDQSSIDLKYKTIVVKEGEVNNHVSFNGDVFDKEYEITTEKLTSESFVSSSGTSSMARANIRIHKVDTQNNEIPLDVDFELYYLINGQEKIVETFTTEGGTYEIENLNYRTYYLRELSAPTGYVVLEDEIIIELNSTREDLIEEERIIDGKTVMVKVLPITVENQETLILEKEGVLENDKEVYNQVGDLVEYTITVTNKGTQTINEIEIVDPMMEDFVAGSIAITVYEADGTIKVTDVKNKEITLEAGDYAVLVGKYEITQADIDEGMIENEAFAKGKYRDYEIETHPDQDEQKGVKEPAIHLKKLIVNPKKFENVGDIIEYEFIATNTGNVALYKVVIEDNLVSNLTYVSINGVAVVDHNNITLQPGDVLLAKASYTVTQADIEAGKVENHAKVTGEDEEGEEVDSEDNADIDGEQVYKLDLLKTNSITTSNQKEKLDNYSQIGDEIHYVVTVTNIGNMIAYNVVVDDIMMKDLVNIVYTHYDKSNVVIATYDDKTIVELTLNPLDRVEMEATYIITQADLDKGSVLNAASVEYTDEEGEVLGDEEDDTSSVGLSQLALLKVDQKDEKKVLEGAEFTLTHIKSGKRWQLKTDKEGVVVAEGLDFGVYSLEETKAPSGYSLLEEKIEIIIDEDNNGVISLTVENIKEIPEMGDTSYQMAAFVLLLLGLMLIIITKEEKA